MLDGLRQFIADIVSPDVQKGAFDETDYRLAATALLIHVVSLDGEPTANEKRKLHSLIETQLQAGSRHGGSIDRLRHPRRGRCGRSLSLHQRHHARGRRGGPAAHRRDDVGDGFRRRQGHRVRGQCAVARCRSARAFPGATASSSSTASRSGSAAPVEGRQPTRPTPPPEATVSTATRHDENLRCRGRRRRFRDIPAKCGCCSAFGHGDMPCAWLARHRRPMLSFGRDGRQFLQLI